MLKKIGKTKTAKKSKYSGLSDDTIVYRWNGINPGNLAPKPKDLITSNGRRPSLSFSLVPPVKGQKAGMTTIGALKGTGILNAEQDAPGHVAVTPKYDTMENWVRLGTSHPCTGAIKSVIIKWEG